jgi:hypothetical protein
MSVTRCIKRPSKVVGRNLLVVGIALLISATSLGIAVAGGTVTKTGKGKPAIYVGKSSVSQVLAKHGGGPATVITHTGELPAGKYLVSYTVDLSMGPEERVTCAASNVEQGNDGTFGTVSNPASGTGEGPTGILGNAAAVDTIEVAAGQKIYVMCDKWGSHKTEGGADAVVTAEKIGTETLNDE